MAVRLEKTIKRYIGLSTDDKPTVGRYLDGVLVESNELPPGSTFLEEDVFLADGSQRIARWNGSSWTYPQLLEAEVIVPAIEALQSEIVALRLGMIAAGSCKDV